MKLFYTPEAPSGTADLIASRSPPGRASSVQEVAERSQTKKHRKQATTKTNTTYDKADEHPIKEKGEGTKAKKNGRKKGKKGRKEGTKERRKEGRNERKKERTKERKKEGRKEGRTEGRKEGRKEGIREGWRGRMDDIWEARRED